MSMKKVKIITSETHRSKYCGQSGSVYILKYYQSPSVSL